MLRGEMMFQGSREGQRWTWSNQNLSMGFIIDAAHKVLVKMAAREKFSKFGNLFGGKHSYNQRGRMEVVVVKLVLICKVSKVGLIFSLVQSPLLSNLFWSTWSKSALVVNIKVVHLDMVLDDMVRVGQSWFRKSQNQGCQVGKIL